MQIFRNFFKSRLGVPVTIGFVGLIGFAFATSDISNTGAIGGVSGDEDIAEVGSTEITAFQLRQAAGTAVDSLRQENPTISLTAFVEQGGLEDVFDQLIERASLSVFSKKYGLRAGDNLVNSEILQIPAFRGSDGNFSKDTYQQVLSSRGLKDADIRKDFEEGLLAKQVLIPASFGARAPNSISGRYASLLKESRTGAIATIPAAAFAPNRDPSAAELKAYYDAHKGEFIRPERRVISYALIGAEGVASKAVPLESEIQDYYKKNSALYAASEKRGITQLIVPTKQAAETIIKGVKSGGSFEAAASQAGLKLSTIAPSSLRDMGTQTSIDIAKSVFAASKGALLPPLKSGLGYHIIRVDNIAVKAGKTLAEARGEIAKIVTEAKKRQVISDFAAQIDDEIANGSSIMDIAKIMNAKVLQTKPITADGMVYGVAGETAPKELAGVLQAAFQAEENAPELLEIEPGKTFLVYEVSGVTPSAAAPLSEITAPAKMAWKLAEGAKLAKAATDRIVKRIAQGSTLAAAQAAEKISLPALTPIKMSREELAKSGGNVPPALALMFSMAQGTTKRLEAPNNRGWIIVSLQKIDTAKLEKNDPVYGQTAREISTLMSREYADQLRKAIAKEVGVKRNDTAFKALRAQLTRAQ